jgi:hypothetical protein
MLPSSSLRRRAIAVVAAYALALQAILAAVVSLQVIQPADAAGVICHTASDLAPSTDEGNDPGRGRQGHQGDHCALCATVPPLLPERAGVARPVQHPTLQLTVGTPRPLWLPRDIRSRPGKPRDPPAAA